MSTVHIERCIDIFNRLLRGEISAVETYTQAVAKFQTKPEISLLEAIRSEHVASANRLRDNVRAIGGTPSNDSGAWGAWARVVEGTAKILSDAVALQALREGEEHGEREYEEALENEEVTASCKEMIRSELLPRQRRHVLTLRRLAEAH